MMTLDKPQLRELSAIIETLLPRKAEFDRFLQNETDVKGIDLISLDTDLGLVIQATCARANTEGWIGKIIDGLSDRFGHISDVQTFAAKVKPLQPPAGTVVVEPYDVCYLHGRPFVDRTSLRNRLRELKGESELKRPRILVIRGGEKTGKSHSLQLINHVANSFGFQSVYVDLMRIPLDNTQDISPVAIGANIVRQMKLKDMPLPGNEQLSRWPAVFFSWLAGELRDDPREWWIVIDGFASVRVSQDVYDFIDDLAHSIESIEPFCNCRIVLISYDDALLVEHALIVERDVTEAIDASHIALFFAQFYRDFGLGDDDEAAQHRISEELRIVLDMIDAEPPTKRLRRMEQELLKSCQRLLMK